VDNFDIKDWYIWSYQEYTGLFNMTADEWLSRQLGKWLDRPVLRFFGWQPYCVSLGYHQKTEEIDLDRCEEASVHVVRRPTGGRAIFHSEELTYSVIYPFEKVELSDFYRLVHLPFVKALNELEIPATFNSAQIDFRNFYRKDKSAACFAIAAKYEVEIDRRKLIGSAQRVFENSILQHGSLLLGKRHAQLVHFLNVAEEKRKILREYIEKNTAFVWQYNPEIMASKLAEKVQEYFSRLFDIRFTPFKINLASKKDFMGILEKSGLKVLN